MPISDKRKIYNQEYGQRMHRISVTLSKTEYDGIIQRAKKENTKPTTMLKNMAMAYYQQEPIIPESITEELREFRFLVLNIANNINQIAHHPNTIQRLADENGLLLEIKKVIDIAEDFAKQKIKNQTQK